MFVEHVPIDFGVSLGDGRNVELVDPIGRIYNNIFNTQDISNEELMNYSRRWLNKLDVVYFTYQPVRKKQVETRASLSWHLTAPEKESIFDAINNPKNKKSLEKVKHLLQKQPKLIDEK